MVAAHVGARTIRFPPFYVNPHMPDLEALIGAIKAGLAHRKGNVALDGVDLHVYNASSPTFPIQDGDVTITCMSLPSLRYAYRNYSPRVFVLFSTLGFALGCRGRKWV